MVVIREWQALTPRQQAQAAANDWSDQDPPSLLERKHSSQPNGRTFEDYESLFTVEGGSVTARVSSIRLAFRTSAGSETVCGIADVLTRPNATRRGLATTLMEETHRRARDRGIRWSWLWTKRSWGAHRAYERLGYFDVYSPDVAVRKLGDPNPIGRLPKGYTARQATRSDASVLESVLSQATEDRLGFVPRTPGSFSAGLNQGWRRARDYRLLSFRGRPVAYAQAVLDRRELLCREFLTADPVTSRPLLDHLESLAEGRWIAFGSTTFTRDAGSELRRRGYEIVPSSHAVLMACPLVPVSSAERARVRATCDGSRFSLHGGDTF